MCAPLLSHTFRRRRTALFNSLCLHLSRVNIKAFIPCRTVTHQPPSFSLPRLVLLHRHPINPPREQLHPQHPKKSYCLRYRIPVDAERSYTLLHFRITTRHMSTGLVRGLLHNPGRRSLLTRSRSSSRTGHNNLIYPQNCKGRICSETYSPLLHHVMVEDFLLNSIQG